MNWFGTHCFSRSECMRMHGAEGGCVTLRRAQLIEQERACLHTGNAFLHALPSAASLWSVLMFSTTFACTGKPPLSNRLLIRPYLWFHPLMYFSLSKFHTSLSHHFALAKINLSSFFHLHLGDGLVFFLSKLKTSPSYKIVILVYVCTLHLF